MRAIPMIAQHFFNQMDALLKIDEDKYYNFFFKLKIALFLLRILDIYSLGKLSTTLSYCIV